jgi:hypothetical protein
MERERRITILDLGHIEENHFRWLEISISPIGNLRIEELFEKLIPGCVKVSQPIKEDSDERW